MWEGVFRRFGKENRAMNAIDFLPEIDSLYSLISGL